jgi:ATP-dependent DNA helicase Q4
MTNLTLIDGLKRQRIQEAFMSGALRIVVATVAFGLGLNKTDVRAVIHYSLPRSLENYLQEIGRAGRDGQAAFCHLFLDDLDFQRLRSLCFADGIERSAIASIVRQLFVPTATSIDSTTNTTTSSCSAAAAASCSAPTDPASPASTQRFVAFAVDIKSRELDMKAEVMETLLTYLQLAEPNALQLLPWAPCTGVLHFHGVHPDRLANTNLMIKTIKSLGKETRYVSLSLSLT